jgi:hypothetical protein
LSFSFELNFHDSAMIVVWIFSDFRPSITRAINLSAPPKGLYFRRMIAILIVVILTECPLNGQFWVGLDGFFLGI